VDGLVRVFRQINDPALTLHIVGEPATESLRSMIADLSRDDPRICTAFGFATDEELVDEISAASLVVLPYTELLNSGAALLALSMGRPILVPFTATTEELSSEVGAGWVTTFRGRLTAETLTATLGSASILSGEPDLSRRDWARGARLHRDAYDQVYRSPAAGSGFR